MAVEIEITKAPPMGLTVWEEPEPESSPPPVRLIGGSEDRRRLMTALSHAQGEIRNAKKSKENPHFKSDYADLAEIADAARPALSRHLIAWTQVPILGETEMYLETTLTHGPSGQYIVGMWPLPLNLRGNQQSLMAAITYAKRGSLAAMVGIVSEDEDDDGNRAVLAGDQEPGVERKPEPQGPTKAQREGEEWVRWAIRKVGTLESVKDISDFEEKYRPSMTDLAKVLPERHQQLVDALAARTEAMNTTPTNG